MRKVATLGGGLASLLLIGLGIASIVVGLNGRDEVRSSVSDESIVGTPDMSPDAIETTVGQDVPDCSVANEQVTNGDEARCFAKYMRIHALEATGGKTYAEMPRFLDEQGKPTADESKAAIDADSGGPVENPERQIWVSETAFATALNTSYFAEQVAKFGIAMGIAMVVIGTGFAVLIGFGGLRSSTRP